MAPWLPGPRAGQDGQAWVRAVVRLAPARGRQAA